MASACSTHVLFNPGNHKTAEDYSKRYGEKEVGSMSPLHEEPKSLRIGAFTC
ncbi:MAG: hypothetical protein DCF22_22085 [Leptolyngbya sp.]|nr:MAG: hypothetical protein DCF22_22085 [Leptolyngbya sp.]